MQKSNSFSILSDINKTILFFEKSERGTDKAAKLENLNLFTFLDFCYLQEEAGRVGGEGGGVKFEPKKRTLCLSSFRKI